jgi:hypothetical protein
MPFNQPFNWNFTDGDLIYGLAPSRRSLVIHFGATILNIKGPSTVDQYRRGQMSTLRKQDRTAWRSFSGKTRPIRDMAATLRLYEPTITTKKSSPKPTRTQQCRTLRGAPSQSLGWSGRSKTNAGIFTSCWMPLIWRLSLRKHTNSRTHTVSYLPTIYREERHLLESIKSEQLPTLSCVGSTATAATLSYKPGFSSGSQPVTYIHAARHGRTT